MALSFAATVTNRWFVAPPRPGHRRPHRRRRDRAAGLPAGAGLAGRRRTAGGRRRSPSSAAALAVVPLVLLSAARPPGRPRRCAAYGADRRRPRPAGSGHRVGAARRAFDGCAVAAETRAFWLLAGGFAICGATTNGLIGTHFVPAAHDHGMPATTAAGAARGGRDLRHRRHDRLRLAHRPGRPAAAARRATTSLRGVVAAGAAGPAARRHVHPSMLVFIVFYGLDWVATVPPTVALCREYFGDRRADRLRLGLRLAPDRRRGRRDSARASSATSPAATTRRSTRRRRSVHSPR